MLLITPKAVKSYREGPKKGTRGKPDNSLILGRLAEYVNKVRKRGAEELKSIWFETHKSSRIPSRRLVKYFFHCFYLHLLQRIKLTTVFDNMKLSIILMAAAVQQALTAAIVNAEPRKLVERSNWYGTCYSASLLSGTTILQANCYNAAGSPHYTQLELNNCFNNNNGQIYVSNQLLNPSSTSKGMNSSAVLASDLAAAIAKCSLSSSGG
jgi:hypothetical protein